MFRSFARASFDGKKEALGQRIGGAWTWRKTQLVPGERERGVWDLRLLKSLCLFCNLILRQVDIHKTQQKPTCEQQSILNTEEYEKFQNNQADYLFSSAWKKDREEPKGNIPCPEDLVPIINAEGHAMLL